MPDAKAGLLDRIARLHQVFNFQTAPPKIKFQIYLGMLKEMFFMLQKISIQNNDLNDIEDGLTRIQSGFYSFLQGKESLEVVNLNDHMYSLNDVMAHFLAARAEKYRNHKYYMELQLSRHEIYKLCSNIHYSFEIPPSPIASLDRYKKNLKRIYDILNQVNKVEDSDLEKMKNSLLTLDNSFYHFLERKKQPPGIAFHKEISKFFLVRSYFQGALSYERGSYEYYKYLQDCQYAIYKLLEALLFVWP